MLLFSLFFVAVSSSDLFSVKFGTLRDTVILWCLINKVVVKFVFYCVIDICLFFTKLRLMTGTYHQTFYHRLHKCILMTLRLAQKLLRKRVRIVNSNPLGSF